VARRSWAGNKLANESIQAAMKACDSLQVTLPHEVDRHVVDTITEAVFSAASAKHL